MKRTFIAALALIAGLGTAASARAGEGSVYVIHGIPGVTVDVYLDGALLQPGFMFTDTIGPAVLPSGSYDVEIKAGGATVLAGSVTVQDGVNLTAIAHLNELGAPTLSLFEDDFSAMGPGLARLVVRHTAAAPEVAVRLQRGMDGDILATVPGLANGGEIGPVEVRPGAYSAGLWVGDTEVFNSGLFVLGNLTSTTVYAVGAYPDTFQLFIRTEDLPRRVKRGNEAPLTTGGADPVMTELKTRRLERGRP